MNAPRTIGIHCCQHSQYATRTGYFEWKLILVLEIRLTYLFAIFFSVKNLAHFIHVTILQFSIELPDFWLHSLGRAHLSGPMDADVMEEVGIYIRQRGILATQRVMLLPSVKA